MVALPSAIGEGRYVTAGGQRIRVNVRRGTGVPLVLCNGIGASLEVLDPLVEQLDRIERWSDSTFPGPEDHPHPLPPTDFPTLPGCWAECCPSWESAWWTCSGCPGAAALRSNSPSKIRADAGAWCWWRRAPECLWCPAHPRVLVKMVTPRRFSDPDYAATIAAELYGGTVRAHGEDVARLFVRQLHAGSKIGYVHQLLAGSVWTSLFALPAVRQETLIVAGHR